MTCKDCTAAAEQLHHGFTAGCDGCKARAISRSPAFFESRINQRQTQAYRRMLEQFGISHEAALKAWQEDFANRHKAAK